MVFMDKLTSFPSLPKNDFIRLTESDAFLNKNGNPFSTTTSMSFLDRYLYSLTREIRTKCPNKIRFILGDVDTNNG